MTSLPTGVVAALPFEAKPFGARLARDAVVDLGGTALYLCGAGARNARRGARRLVEHGVGSLVSWGTAGALSPRLSAGDCLVPGIVLCSDAAYETDTDWQRRLAGQLAATIPVEEGPLYTAAAIVADVDEKAKLHAELGVRSVDLESGAIAETAMDAQVPFACVRAVLDTATMTLPAAVRQGLDEHGFLDKRRIIGAMLRESQELGPIERLLQCYRAARRTLNAVVQSAGPGLLSP